MNMKKTIFPENYQALTEEQKIQFFNLFELYYGKSDETDRYYSLMDFLNSSTRRYKGIVGTVGPDGNGIIESDIINKNLTSDRNDSPNIAVYVSKHPRISLNLKNAGRKLRKVRAKRGI